jgi:hypothetical protein
MRAGVRTFAISRDGLKPEGRMIFLAEMAALAVMLWKIGQPLCLFFLGLYLLLVLMRSKILGQQVILIQADGDRKFQILMMDYYQVFLPLALLAVACGIDNAAVLVLAVHVLLFPLKIRDAFRDAFFSVRRFILQRG